MRFLADENVAAEVVHALVEAGHDVLRVLDVMPGASDKDVLQRAYQEARIILTHDQDFGNVLRYPLHAHRGILLMRFKDQSPANVTRHLDALIDETFEQKVKDRLVIVREDQVRFYSGEMDNKTS
jgi:predicted nuclease of predicted toxin-antitoxin system